MKVIASIGRGGTGKTAFIALITKYLIEIGEVPLLLVDADPDQSLGEMVGVDLTSAGKKTITELVVETFFEEGGTLAGMPPSERIESAIWEEGLYEGEDFDFLAVGTKYTEGCYCAPDAALKGALERLTKTYKYVLIDSPAGLEQLNRRISDRFDDIFDILDPSKKAFEHVKRAHKVIEEVGINFRNFYLVGGYEFPDELGGKAEEETGFKYLGKIAYDELVRDFVLEGRSLLEVPSSSPAYASIRRIMERAGYISLGQLLSLED
jgi:CO dehydrogenase maturation factor